ncbi:MAG: hypothetical protein QXG97_00115 [Nitrososphaerota archaeon]
MSDNTQSSQQQNQQNDQTTYTQEDLEKQIQIRLKSLKRDLSDKDKAIESLKQELEALKASIKKSVEEPLPDDVQGKIQLIQAQHQREIDALKRQIEEAQKVSAQERERRLQTERDKLIQDALSQAGCLDMKAGYRFFLPQVFYDEAEGTWMFNLTKGGTCSIADGVAEELPSYLRSSGIRDGGSGSPGGPGSATRKSIAQKQYEDLKKQVEDLRQRAVASGRNSDIQSYRRMKRKLEDLGKQLSGT